MPFYLFKLILVVRFHQGTQLQKDLQSDYIISEQLRSDLQQLQQSFDGMRDSLGGIITNLQVNNFLYLLLQDDKMYLWILPDLPTS